MQILDKIFKEAKKVKYIWPWEETKIRRSKISCLMIVAPIIAKNKYSMRKAVDNLFIVLADLKTNLYQPKHADYIEFGNRFDPVLNFEGDGIQKMRIREYLIYYMLSDDLQDKEKDKKESGRYNPFNDISLYKNTNITMAAKAHEELSRLAKAPKDPEIELLVGGAARGFWWP